MKNLCSTVLAWDNGVIDLHVCSGDYNTRMTWGMCDFFRQNDSHTDCQFYMRSGYYGQSCCICESAQKDLESSRLIEQEIDRL